MLIKLTSSKSGKTILINHNDIIYCYPAIKTDGKNPAIHGTAITLRGLNTSASDMPIVDETSEQIYELCKNEIANTVIDQTLRG
jgi:hypothetical protein